MSNSVQRNINTQKHLEKSTSQDKTNKIIKYGRTVSWSKILTLILTNG